MKRKRRTRLLYLFLGLSLALSPAARALTPEQAGDLLDVYYIDDVPEEVLEMFRDAEICVGELEERLILGDVVYGD